MTTPSADAAPRWYSGVTRYQWLVLLVASLGWIFDTFEGQVFVASMREAMPSLVPADTPQGRIAWYNNVALAAFSLGGAVGGIGFGMLADRIGRKRTLSLTILCYSLFTCLSAFAQDWTHLVAMRFLVALGVGGEWAVASALVAEVFPQRARAHVGSIFHASSVLGAYLAAAVGAFVIGSAAIAAWAAGPDMEWASKFVDPSSLPWRIGFALGVLPALLVLWIRSSINESAAWQAARQQAADRGSRMGALGDLFHGPLLRRTLVGTTLATVGLATFWSVHIYGKDVLRAAVEDRFVAEAGGDSKRLSPQLRQELLAPRAAAVKRWEMLGMFLVTTGGGLGLLAFGPACERFGRRGAFLAFHAGGLVAALIVFQAVRSVALLLVTLPAFGFLTLGMHAGYAVYFPELYPTRLRSAGAGFCFNAGRVLTVPVLLAAGYLQDRFGYTLADVASLFSLSFLIGILALAFAPETKGQALAD
jgi:MFS family permease